MKLTADDLWDCYSYSDEKQPKDIMIEFNVHPLYYVAVMRNRGVPCYTIYERLTLNEKCNKDYLLEIEVDEDFEEGVELAKRVMKYFDSKIVLRILREHPLTEFLQKVGKISNSENSVMLSQMAVLVKLVDLYLENVESEKMLAPAVSFAEEEHSYLYHNDVITYQGSTKTTRLKDSGYTLYWRDKKGHFIKKHINKSNFDSPAWALLAKQPTLKISGQVVIIKAVGNDCRVATLNGRCYELDFNQEE